ncbi:MAG: trypsin-like peptidase domain-containing protein [Elusimicrobia bacterium]|nr:trypsin-like peptidase domain-containing protein [Elusimicrobiota bacterium]
MNIPKILFVSTLLFLSAAALEAAAPGREAGSDEEVRRSVVKIFATHRVPNYYQPWQFNPQTNGTGSGVIISGGRILTNAHVASDQVFLQVRKAGQARKYTARVETVAHDCELALLKVDDPEFFKGASDLKFGELPFQRDKATVYGFPVGGDDLSVTEGIVSRIEVTTYLHSGRSLLTIQTDAAINPGNSGGPMMKDGKIVGVSFQHFGGQNIGYAVPVPLIRRFLDEVASTGGSRGTPRLGVVWQRTEGETLRKFLGLKDKETGILIKKVINGSAAWEVLREGDVLLSLGGIPVANDGTIPFRKNERVDMSHAVSMRRVGETLKVSILREGKVLGLDLKLKDHPSLVEGPFYDVRPSYFVYAGLVFTPLTRNYTNAWPWKDVPENLRHYLLYGWPAPERKQIILVASVLPDDVNLGYHNLRHLVVERINGRPLSELSDVVKALERPSGEYQIIETDEMTDIRGKIVLNAAQAQAAHAAILERFAVPSDRSEDLKGE